MMYGCILGSEVSSLQRASPHKFSCTSFTVMVCVLDFVVRLTMQDIVLPSFSAQYGYKVKLCATDVVLACAAVLEGVVSHIPF
jgi:hypothetical protein